METLFVLTTIVFAIVLPNSYEAGRIHAEISNRIGCYKTQSHEHVTQYDANGRKCRGTINFSNCSGYCESWEIGNWKFPYKITYSPVCIFDGQEHLTQTLGDCDDGVILGTERYKYTVPINCKCAICSTSDTVCLGKQKRTGQLWPETQENSEIMDGAVLEDEKWSNLGSVPEQPPFYY